MRWGSKPEASARGEDTTMPARMKQGKGTPCMGRERIVRLAIAPPPPGWRERTTDRDPWASTPRKLETWGDPSLTRLRRTGPGPWGDRGPSGIPGSFQSGVYAPPAARQGSGRLNPSSITNHLDVSAVSPHHGQPPP